MNLGSYKAIVFMGHALSSKEFKKYLNSLIKYFKYRRNLKKQKKSEKIPLDLGENLSSRGI